MKLCECGCGNEVSNDKNRFLKGHNGKNNKGRKWSEESKKQFNDIDNIISRFESKIEIDKNTGCWEWIGGKCQGYGGFSCCIKGKYKTYPAHRFSYMMYIGEIPDGLQILHECNNKSCVNPDHIYAGTHQDNMRDLRNAGTLSGKNNPNYGKISSKEKKEKIKNGVKKWISNNPDFKPEEWTSKEWIITKPNGDELIIKNLTKYCRDNDINLTSCSKGYYIKDNGWKVERL